MTRNDIPRPYDDDPLGHDAAFLAQPAPGAYLITDAQLSDLMKAAGLLTCASEEPQAQQAHELVRGVVQAARKVGNPDTFGPPQPEQALSTEQVRALLRRADVGDGWVADADDPYGPLHFCYKQHNYLHRILSVVDCDDDDNWRLAIAAPTLARDLITERTAHAATPTPESPSVSVSRELLSVVLALFPDPIRSDRLGDYRPEIAQAVSALRAALTQPEAPAPADEWEDGSEPFEFSGGTIAMPCRRHRQTGEVSYNTRVAQVMQELSRLSAQELPAEVREVLLLVAEFVGAHHDYMMSDDDNDSLFWHLAVQEAKLRELNPARLRALVGAEAGEQDAR